jgi:hypothetical protein
MVPQTDIFKVRKKYEKRAQAQRQVELAYKQCQEFQFANGQSFKGLHIGNEIYEWRIRMEPEMEDIYSTLDIVKALNIPRERLRDWMNRGFIKPSLPSTRQGTIAIFTKADVFMVALFGKLLEMGFKREVASGYIESIVLTRMEGNLDFIILKSVIQNGEPEIIAYKAYGKTPINLTISEKGDVICNFGPLPAFQANSWDDIHILNIENIRTEVEAALAKLG